MFDPELPPHQRHSETSKAAALAIRPTTNALQERVLSFIRKRGAYGATDDEIQVALGMLLQTETPRRVELVRKGLVRDSGRTRKTRSGRAAVVWVACDD